MTARIESCTGKRAFRHKGEAIRAAKVLHRKYSAAFCEYRCAHCGAWHVGEAAAR